MSTAIEFEHVSKQYRLGLVSTRTLSHDIRRWWLTSVLRQEDPYLKIGETNDRATRGNSEYVWALRDIDFKVEQGDVVGIIGKNGAGKSTLLKLLSRVTGPTTGTIRAHGRIGSLLEVGTGFHGEMTGRENIFMNGAILGMTRNEIQAKLDEIIDFSGCERYIDTPVKRYSSGMTVRLGFAVAAFLEPEILVVDEVLAVGDAEFQKKAIGKMKDVSQGEGRTVLFVSHNMGAVRNLCKRGVVLEKGQLVYDGTAVDAIAHYLLGNELSSQDEVRNLTEFRMADLPLDVQFESITVQDRKNLATKEDIVFRIQVLANRDVEDFQFYFTIYNSEEYPIGGIFDDGKFSIKKGEHKTYDVTLRNHNLAKGNYYVSFALGKGDFAKGIRAFDVVEKCYNFEINRYDVQHGYSTWSPGWGNLIFQSITHEVRLK